MNSHPRMIEIGDKNMIHTLAELKSYVHADQKYYYDIKDTVQKRLLSRFTKDDMYMVKKYLLYLRLCEYTKTKIEMGISGKCIYSVAYILLKRKLNNMAIKLGIHIPEFTCEKGLTIFHSGGGIVIHPDARIGKGCQFHGNNCIGNNGRREKCPIVGNNVEMGVGAKIIGDVLIADSVVVGAGAVVVHSIKKKGAVVVGIPAKEPSR